MKTENIKVDYVTRVEGHGNIICSIKDGEIKDLKLEIIESPRFFEAMVLGRNYDYICQLTSRICGICACAHCTTSIRATEDAFDIKPSEQTLLLRKIVFYGEQLQSHILHEYFLAAPDFFGAGSVFPLVSSHPDVVKRALRLKKLANTMCETLAGRHVMPISLMVGGFTNHVSEKALRELKGKLEDAKDDIDATVDLFTGIEIPDFTRETEYISIKSDNEYAFYDGKLYSSISGYVDDNRNYKNLIKERIEPHSTAKHAGANKPSYQVGALARVNNNFNELHPKAKKAAEKLGFEAPSYNPYMINVAQIIETVHCYEEALECIDRLLTLGVKKEQRIKLTLKAARGVGICEAPRGTLIHDYTYDEYGEMTACNLIIPTNQNFANIEDDMRALVPQIMDKKSEEIELLLEMLVRAYDPCISCSTHMVQVRFE